MEVNSSNFKEEVLDSALPVIVDFWAEWCIPCRMIENTILNLEKKYEGKVKIVRVNVDENQDIAVQYNIMSIPTLCFFINGVLADRIVGAVPAYIIENKISQILDIKP